MIKTRRGTNPPPRNPKKNGKDGGGKSKLTDAQIAEARERAEKAGRRYPNLIDNMFVAKKAKEKTAKLDDDYFD